MPAQLHNLDGIMSNSTDAGDGGLCTRRRSRALMAPGGLGDNSVQVCDRLAGKQSCSLHTLSHGGGAAGACLCVAPPGTISHQMPITQLIHLIGSSTQESPLWGWGTIACKSVGGSAAHCLAAILPLIRITGISAEISVFRNVHVLQMLLRPIRVFSKSDKLTF